MPDPPLTQAPRFLAFSRHEAESWNPLHEPHVIVSISTPGCGAAKPRRNEHTRAVYALQFHDLDAAPSPAFVSAYGPARLFQREDAEALVAFLGDHRGLTVLAHCDMGTSRSAAVAAALANWHGARDQEARLWDRKRPNSRVYRMLLEALHGQPVVSRA